MPKADADRACGDAACIGCDACVAACPNGSVMLFTMAKITDTGALPQQQTERDSRTLAMTLRQDAGGFGGRTHIGECTDHASSVTKTTGGVAQEVLQWQTN